MKSDSTKYYSADGTRPKLPQTDGPSDPVPSCSYHHRVAHIIISDALVAFCCSSQDIRQTFPDMAERIIELLTYKKSNKQGSSQTNTRARSDSGGFYCGGYSRRPRVGSSMGQGQAYRRPPQGQMSRPYSFYRPPARQYTDSPVLQHREDPAPAVPRRGSDPGAYGYPSSTVSHSPPPPPPPAPVGPAAQEHMRVNSPYLQAASHQTHQHQQYITVQAEAQRYAPTPPPEQPAPSSSSSSYPARQAIHMQPIPPMDRDPAQTAQAQAQGQSLAHIRSADSWAMSARHAHSPPECSDMMGVSLQRMADMSLSSPRDSSPARYTHRSGPGSQRDSPPDICPPSYTDTHSFFGDASMQSPQLSAQHSSMLHTSNSSAYAQVLSDREREKIMSSRHNSSPELSRVLGGSMLSEPMRDMRDDLWPLTTGRQVQQAISMQLAQQTVSAQPPANHHQQPIRAQSPGPVAVDDQLSLPKFLDFLDGYGVHPMARDERERERERERRESVQASEAERERAMWGSMKAVGMGQSGVGMVSGGASVSVGGQWGAGQTQTAQGVATGSQMQNRGREYRMWD